MHATELAFGAVLGHRVPHAPQLLASLVGLTQVPLQEICGAAQAVPMQVPPAHISPAAQRRPQAPQLRGSLMMSVQPVLQMVRGGMQPGGAPQRPRRQIWPDPQRLPQEPQFDGSMR